jgi:class 3 adenylate cyclase/CHASE2 domain-containing sensor protein
MTPIGVKRKLTAILSADVKGYSRLMAEDEAGTVQLLKQSRKVMAALIQQYRGRVVDAPGDNLLAEFASVVDAVQCAVKIQEELKDRNAHLPEERKMEFRIGINLGDVIEDGDRIYGDGINIAARLEGLAEAGGICISRTVYDQIKNKLSLSYDDIGEQTVKNIAEPLRAYRVIRPGAKLRSQPGFLEKTRRPLGMNLLIVCLVMVFCMPFANAFNLNLLTKIWQCRLILLPNENKVTVVTIGPDEYKKLNVPQGQEQPPPYLTNPKMWRRYHPTLIKKLHEMRAEAVGFDFWFSPAFDDRSAQATGQFAAGLKWARLNNLPVVLGQAQNRQDPEIYSQADWGYISLYKDLTWINKLMYLYAWDKMNLSGAAVEKPALFVQLLAQKLRLSPVIESRGVRLIGRPIPKRLWLAFSKTPFTAVSYHEVYNGWADKKMFSGRIVLIGVSSLDTDYYEVPYSPTDFTPDNKDDPAGMPGVFLFAHAINQIINGRYQSEMNDEWLGLLGDKWISMASLESLFFLLAEAIMTCLLLHFANALIKNKHKVMLACEVMSLVAFALIMALAITPVLFGLANFIFAALLFIAFAAARRLRIRKLNC